ncbi:hypothetical protein K504DRAFT_461092 [Pleomassaria siparia CBS 279.74]|uniref:Mitochondrial export translocase Oxa2 n=1 Tax=Pleomassaria siparia CBS 279.74 TaxID=1314801 RepID=A0A6G1JWB5_9PLEO|nr:hypothetical protein K504DRAFT_461092 [Pleomassaria siparia CBS 279.74]
MDLVLIAPHQMLQLLHTGLPWYAALPLSAFILRGALTLSIGRRVRGSMARYLGLIPLRQAMAAGIRDETMRSGLYKTHGENKIATARKIRSTMSSLDEKWDSKLGTQLGWTFFQLPIFLTMAELVRSMCNTNNGLFGMGLNAIGLGENKQEILHGEMSMTPTTYWFEPSFIHEGMLWFPNLCLPDPIGVLPYVVSALMFSNVYMTNNSPDVAGKMNKTSRNIRYALLGVSLVIGPLCQQVPAALLLYWASSTTSVLVWNRWLDWKYPAVKGYGACARPLLPALKLESSPLNQTGRRVGRSR